MIVVEPDEERRLAIGRPHRQHVMQPDSTKRGVSDQVGPCTLSVSADAIVARIETLKTSSED